MINLSKWLKENPRKEKTTIKLKCPLSKTDPRFKHYVTSCMTKHRFKTKDDVVAFLDKTGLKQTTERNLYAYKCMYCNGWHFSGHNNGKRSRKLQSAELVAKKSIDQGMKKVEVYIKGPGSGRETAIRAIQAAGLEITLIKDVTPIPHNGCRPPKKRRV